jgi:hypothetical protein
MKEIVYILTNECMPGLIKIGFTSTSIEQRTKELYSPGVPYPFECFYAAVVTNGRAIEKKLHYAFSDHRVPTGKEFFRIDKEKVKAILELIAIENMTPPINPEVTEEMKEFVARRPPFRFSFAQIAPGAELCFVSDEQITCKVIDDKSIEFEGQITSLSAAASEILNRFGRKTTQVQGPIYWLYEGETLEERRRRLVVTL